MRTAKNSDGTASDLAVFQIANLSAAEDFRRKREVDR
jgi:hypothetical protein